MPDRDRGAHADGADSSRDDAFLAQAREALVRRSEAVEPRIAAELAARRAVALDEAHGRVRALRLATVAAVLVVAIVGFWSLDALRLPSSGPHPHDAPPGAGALELLAGGDDVDRIAGSDDLELYENIDFYLWLEQMAEAG